MGTRGISEEGVCETDSTGRGRAPAFPWHSLTWPTNHLPMQSCPILSISNAISSTLSGVVDSGGEWTRLCRACMSSQEFGQSPVCRCRVVIPPRKVKQEDCELKQRGDVLLQNKRQKEVWGSGWVGAVEVCGAGSVGVVGVWGGVLGV